MQFVAGLRACALSRPRLRTLRQQVDLLPDGAVTVLLRLSRRHHPAVTEAIGGAGRHIDHVLHVAHMTPALERAVAHRAELEPLSVDLDRIRAGIAPETLVARLPMGRRCTVAHRRRGREVAAGMVQNDRCLHQIARTLVARVESGAGIVMITRIERGERSPFRGARGSGGGVMLMVRVVVVIHPCGRLPGRSVRWIGRVAMMPAMLVMIGPSRMMGCDFVDDAFHENTTVACVPLPGAAQQVARSQRARQVISLHHREPVTHAVSTLEEQPEGVRIAPVISTQAVHLRLCDCARP
jgi:hypothetical protein